LPSAPVAWALGKVSQKPGTAGCISETGTGGACQDGTALNGAFDLAASADREPLRLLECSDAVAIFDRDGVTRHQRPRVRGWDEGVTIDATGG
jgi:hypothetical protein